MSRDDRRLDLQQNVGNRVATGVERRVRFLDVLYNRVRSGHFLSPKHRKLKPETHITPTLGAPAFSLQPTRDVGLDVALQER